MNFSFFSKLFQKKVVKLSLTDLNNELIEEEKNRFNDFQKKAGLIFSRINYLLKEINQEIKSINEKEIFQQGKIGKIVSSSKKDFVNQLNSLILKLSPSSINSFEEIKNYSFNSNKLLESELIKIHKLIALTAFGAKEEMKEVGQNLKELNSAFNELQKNLFESKLIELNKIKFLLNEFNETEKKINELILFKKKSDSDLKEFNSLIEKKSIELNELNSSKEAKELNDSIKEIEFIETQKNQLKLIVSSLIGKADKPLKKLIKLIDSNRFFSKNYSFNELNSWLFDSFKAIKSDQKGEKIKLASMDCIKLINENSLNAKNEKEKNKWLEALNEIISTNFFEEFFWKLNSFESKKNSLKEKINSLELNKKIKQKKDSINELNQKINELNSLNKKKENLLNEEKEKLIDLKNKIIFVYSKFSGKKIELN